MLEVVVSLIIAIVVLWGVVNILPILMGVLGFMGKQEIIYFAGMIMILAGLTILIKLVVFQ